MQRREFLATSAAAALAAFASTRTHAADAPPAAATQLIDLRTYHFASPEKMQAFEQFLGQAGAPAFNRAGVEPVGLFKLLTKDNAPLKLETDPLDLYLLLPHNSLDSLLAFDTKLATDDAYQKAGGDLLTAAKKGETAYTRYENSLLQALPAVPRVEVRSKSPDRLVQLRTYESPTEERGAKKIHMFTDGGELAIFRAAGMPPVFMGRAIAGAKMPNLTYMLEFDNDAAQKAAWKAFGANPDWKTLSKNETYKETVSNITNLILRPCAGSQV
jgi:hypothetical protein